MESPRAPDEVDIYGRRQRIGLALGPLVFGLMVVLSPPEGLSQEGWFTAAVALWMAVWWITEAIPIPVVALLPLVMFPLLGAGTMQASAEPYANPLIFLFLGGFLIATAMQRWGLHKRMALRIIMRVGTGPRALIAGFMASSAFLSMWVSNTATAMMMLPIGLSVVQLAEETEATPRSKERFALALLLGIAYGCNIGGMATLIGTPPNALLAGFFEEQYQYTLSFVDWMKVGLPLVIVGLWLTFLILTRLAFPLQMTTLPGGRGLLAGRLSQLGHMSQGEKVVAVVFVTTAVLWLVRPLLNDIWPALSDAGIAMAGGLVLFVIPVDWKKGVFAHSWAAARQLPWGTLLLFGGGLSLASAFVRTGLSVWIGEALQGLGDMPLWVILLCIVGTIVLLTELTSNTATSAAFLPVLAALAIGIGQNPLLLAIPAVFGASCAFMLPVATPPNAIVYGSGKVPIPRMAQAGIWLNTLFVLLITIFAYTLILWVFQIQVGVVPTWAQ